jgi:hypothetical protein
MAMVATHQPTAPATSDPTWMNPNDTILARGPHGAERYLPVLAAGEQPLTGDEQARGHRDGRDDGDDGPPGPSQWQSAGAAGVVRREHRPEFGQTENEVVPITAVHRRSSGLPRVPKSREGEEVFHGYLADQDAIASEVGYPATPLRCHHRIVRQQLVAPPWLIDHGSVGWTVTAPRICRRFPGRLLRRCWLALVVRWQIRCPQGPRRRRPVAGARGRLPGSFPP